MKMVTVDSTCIKAYGYRDSRKELTVNFKRDNSVYKYYDVPYTKVLHMLEADSVGKYFRTEIMGKYSSDKITD